MDKNVIKSIERDCVKIMLPCFRLHLLREVLALVLPVLTSWMVGDMADALLALDAGLIRDRLVLFTLAFLAGVFVQPLVRLRENLLMTRLGFGYGNFIFARFLRLPVKTARTLDAAALVRRVDSDTTDYYFILMQKYTRPLTAALCTGAMAAMFVLRGIPALFVLAVLALACLPLLRAHLNGRDKARLGDEERKYGEVRGEHEYGMMYLRDVLSGFSLGERYIERLHGLYAAHSGRTGRARDRFDAMDGVFDFVCSYGAPLGAIAIGSLLIALGKMGVGALLAGYLIMPTVTEVYRYLEELVLGRHEERAVRARLEIFYSPEEDISGETPEIREICLENVTFSYPGETRPVLDKTDLTLPLDAPVRLTGSNGAGKSTVLSLISGIYAPDSGRVTDGEGRELTAGALRALTSVQEQDGHIFSASVAENLFICREDYGKARELLDRLGFEKPLDYQITESGGCLSPGERKKLLLVRALMDPAPVLVLDEPLNHLDAAGAAALAEMIRRRGKRLVAVYHTGVEGVMFRDIPV